MSKRSIKKYYPKDLTFCICSDFCPITCPRKISDYELRLLKYEVSWQDFENTVECWKKNKRGVQA